MSNFTPWEDVNKRRYQKQEKRTSKLPGARPQVNSGRIWSSLRDNKLKSFIGLLLIDNKDTEDGSFRFLKTKWLELRRDANRTPPGCHPCLQVDIQDISLMVVESELWQDIEKYVLELESRLMDLEDE